MSGAPIVLLTPMANPTVEREMRRLLPASCDYVVGRLVSAQADSTERLRAYGEDLSRSLTQFGVMPLSAIAFACTATSYLVGAQVEDRIAASLPQPVLWAARAICSTLQAMGARRIAVVSPYPDDLHAAGLTYWRAAGVDVIAQHRVETGSSDTRFIYGLGSQAALAALAAAKASAPDAVLLAGTGMPTLDLIEPGGHPPVISSNHCLAAAMIAHSKVQP